MIARTAWSISASVVYRDRLNLTEPCATGRGTFIASSTRDGSADPLEQAAPADAHTWRSDKSSRSASACSGGKPMFVVLPRRGASAAIATASGTAAAVWGAGISFPWSEDLHLAAGPFYFERLTQRIRFREGDAWAEAEEAPADGVWIGGTDGKGVRFTFVEPVPIRKGVTSRNHGFELGLLEVELGAAVSYLMEPVAREDL